jgi:hypothetical protein
MFSEIFAKYKVKFAALVAALLSLGTVFGVNLGDEDVIVAKAEAVVEEIDESIAEGAEIGADLKAKLDELRDAVQPAE